MTTAKSTEAAAEVLATAVRELAEEFPMAGGPVLLTVRTGTGPAVEMELTSELAEAIARAVGREGANWREQHGDQSGTCAHCHGGGRADQRSKCPSCWEPALVWRTHRPTDPPEFGWWQCEQCEFIVLGSYFPANLMPVADLVVDEAMAEDPEHPEVWVDAFREFPFNGPFNGPPLTDDQVRAALRDALDRRGLAEVPVLDSPEPTESY
ncbi:hypothetical protein ACIGZJ_36000 [Kitasatospora sp. NPDC052868]|uniref:hypothetical protein n=1 Tax=Kitasatospora sp. NPDC052868 TaxID=3364060 RepID=UPI0037C79A18